jgi:hypothetical protein
MIKLLLAAALMLGPSFAEKTKTARPALAHPPAMEGCDVSELDFVTGKMLDEALKARAQEATGAASVRVYRKGEPVTQDLRADRLNLELDQAGRVVSARCG